MTALDNVVHAEPGESQDIELLQKQIDDIYHRNAKALLIGPPDMEPVEVPASAFEALRIVVGAMAKGQTILLMPRGSYVTTQQAAELLHVSRPHIVKLCDEGRLPYERVGSHRRLKIEDVLDFKTARTESREEKLSELTRISEELPGGYA